jgi:predicted dehydrogenase
MSANNCIGIGIVGCGRIADLQVAGYLDNPRARLVAVCDTDAEVAESRRRQWKALRAYTSLDALLADSEIDAVEILTPHDLHVPHTLAALAAGKHVSLQKPPTRTLAELDRLASAAGKAGRVLRVFENFAHYPPHRLARRLVDEGAIGTPLSVRIKTALGNPADGWDVPMKSQAWRVDRERCGGGALTFDHGYHCFHMGQCFMPGVAVERVHAFIHWMQVGSREWIDGPALVSWKYAGDSPARYGSWEAIASIGMRIRSKYYVSDDRIEVHGSEGILWVNRCTGSLLDEPSVVLYHEGETRAFHDIETDWAASFRDGGIDFVDALLDGREASQTVAEARATLAFAIAAGRSADEGREVTIAEVG